MDTEPEAPPGNEGDARVPLFGTWRRAYVVVIAWLAVQVIAFAWMSRTTP